MSEVPTPTVTAPLIVLLVPVGIVAGLIASGLIKKGIEIRKGRSNDR